MAMIKRGTASGKIEGTINKKADVDLKSDLNLEWAEMPIKDVLDVPTTSSHDVTVNLDDDDDGEISIRV